MKGQTGSSPVHHSSGTDLLLSAITAVILYLCVQCGMKMRLVTTRFAPTHIKTPKHAHHINSRKWVKRTSARHARSHLNPSHVLCSSSQISVYFS